MRKNCSSDQEKLLKFETEGREFPNILRSLEQFFLTVVQNNFENKIPFLYMGLRFSVASSGLKRTILQDLHNLSRNKK